MRPPNGACGSSATVGPLMWQMPDAIRFDTASARATSRPNTAADSPYSVSLATRTASSTPRTRTIGFTGPKDSSP